MMKMLTVTTWTENGKPIVEVSMTDARHRRGYYARLRLSKKDLEEILQTA